MHPPRITIDREAEKKAQQEALIHQHGDRCPPHVCQVMIGLLEAFDHLSSTRMRHDFTGDGPVVKKNKSKGYAAGRADAHGRLQDALVNMFGRETFAQFNNFGAMNRAQGLLVQLHAAYRELGHYED